MSRSWHCISSPQLVALLTINQCHYDLPFWGQARYVSEVIKYFISLVSCCISSSSNFTSTKPCLFSWQKAWLWFCPTEASVTPPSPPPSHCHILFASGFCPFALHSNLVVGNSKWLADFCVKPKDERMVKAIPGEDLPVWLWPMMMKTCTSRCWDIWASNLHQGLDVYCRDKTNTTCKILKLQKYVLFMDSQIWYMNLLCARHQWSQQCSQWWISQPEQGCQEMWLCYNFQKSVTWVVFSCLSCMSWELCFIY